MIHLFWFFVNLLFLKNILRIKIKVHIIESWMSKWIFKVVKSCARKMAQRTHLLLNSKMVKRKSNSNCGSNQLIWMVDMPMYNHNWKISATKTKFWVHSTHQNFQNCHFSRVKIRMYWWKIKALKCTLLLQTLWNANLVIIKLKYQTRDEIKRTQSCCFVLHYFDLKFCLLFCINKPISWN